MAEIKKILYATDFSDLSALALDYAVYLARQCGAEMACLYVVDDSYQYWPGMDVAALPAGPPPDELLAAAETRMAEFLAAKVSADVEVKGQVLLGRPFVEIIRYARSQNADLIVAGTHGRGALSHVLMGSVAEKLVRKSPCPVLTVRHPDHDFKMP